MIIDDLGLHSCTIYFTEDTGKQIEELARKTEQCFEDIIYEAVIKYLEELLCSNTMIT